MDIFLVGGAVRDRLLGLPVRERDWVVVGATPDELTRQGFKPVGKDFPVFLHPDTGEEYALARQERKTGHGYGGFEFTTSSDISLEDDLLRRDLTVNAIAEDGEGNIIDPFNGQQDLQERILRHVSPAFREDPLRVLRVARFAARFHSLGFAIHPQTMDLMKEIVRDGEINHLVAERVWQEVYKALKGPDPAVFLEVLRSCGALEILLPEVDKLFGVPQRKDYHPEVDTGVHTLMALEQACKLSPDPLLRFCVLVHDLGKGETPEDILPRHIGHEQRSLPLIHRLCERMGVPNDFRKHALVLAEHHTLCHKVKDLRAKTLYKVLKACNAFHHPDALEIFLLGCEADARGRTGMENDPYPQTETFRKALQAAQTISASEIMEQENLGGEKLGNALKQRQIQAIAEHLGIKP
jgi:tRNA nucleotidyltransferase (CCA-adding enzyme)